MLSPWEVKTPNLNSHEQINNFVAKPKLRLILIGLWETFARLWDRKIYCEVLDLFAHFIYVQGDGKVRVARCRDNNLNFVFGAWIKHRPKHFWVDLLKFSGEKFEIGQSDESFGFIFDVKVSASSF